MTFVHTCNESGTFSAAALDTIQKFPLVTIEKGQGFLDGTGRHAEDKIVEQLAAIKARNPGIATVTSWMRPLVLLLIYGAVQVFYMNSVLDWCTHYCCS